MAALGSDASPKGLAGMTPPHAGITPASRRRRLSQSTCTLRKANSSCVFVVPLHVGQDVLCLFDGEWREATIVKQPPHRSYVQVVDKKTWTEHRMPVANVAIRATTAVLGASAEVERCLAASSPASKVTPIKTPSRTIPASMRTPETQVALKKTKCRPEKAGLDSKVMRSTDKALHARVDNGEAPGVISVVYRKGILAHLDCYGYADVERKVPFRPDSIVRLYSMTKCIVTIAVAICVEDGLMSFDDEVSKFIPAFSSMKVKLEDGSLVAAERQMTVLHLLTHTAGFGYGPMLGDEADGEAEERFVPLIERAGFGRTSPSDSRAITTLEHWANELAAIPLQHQPGTEWLYSYSHDVVGRVVEVVTGQRLDAFMQKRIFAPLRMVDTGFEVPLEKWDRVAAMYRRFEVEQSSPEKAKETVAEVALASEKDEVQHSRTTEAEKCSPEKTTGGAVEGTPAVATDATAQSRILEAESKGAEEATIVPSTENDQTEPQEKTIYELKRIDNPNIEKNEWMAGNASPILSGGGSVDAMTGGLVSTAADYARFCCMLLRKGELDGVRVLSPAMVEMLSSNQLPRATGGCDGECWAFNTAGVGFGLLGSVTVAHPDLDEALRPNEYGWGGMAGTAWTNDPEEDFFLLSFSLVAFDLSTEEELRAGVRAAIARFDQRKEERLKRQEQAIQERLKREQRRLEKLQRQTSKLRPVEGVADPRMTTPSRQRTSPPAASVRVQKTIQKLQTPPAKKNPQQSPTKQKVTSPQKVASPAPGSAARGRRPSLASSP